MKYLTLQQIKAHHPCPDKFRKVRRFFGKRKRIAVTVAAAVKVAPLFDWDWLAYNLLRASAWKAYGEARASAWKAYSEATTPALEAYGEARASAWKVYSEVRAPAIKAYNEARASAFARAYLSM